MTTISPNKDFYQWVNNDWLENEKIPEDYSSWGGFIKLYDEGLNNLIKLVKNLDSGIIRDIWDKSMNRYINWDTNSNIVLEIESFNNIIDSKNGLSDYIAYCHINGIESFLSFDKSQDMKNSENVKLDISPSGLSLPNRDYYFNEKYEKHREMFRDHLLNVQEIFNLDKKFAEYVFEFEKKIAYITMSSSQKRDYDKYYTNSDLIEFYEQMDLLNFNKDKLDNYNFNDNGNEYKSYSKEIEVFMENLYNKLNIKKNMKENYIKTYLNYNKKYEYYLTKEKCLPFIVYDGDYFRRLFTLIFNNKNDEHIKYYHQYKIISSLSSYGTKELNDEFFDFYCRKLNGQEKSKTNEKKSINLLNSWIGELVGQEYIKKYFSENDKLKIIDMINNITDIMKVSLENNDWLTSDTKLKALNKLSKFTNKIGYPEKWKDYSELNILENDSLFNIRKKISTFMFKTEILEKINKKVDKTEWHMTPQTVNAYFSPQLNEIVFPAAILQPPFYHKSEDTIDFKVEDNIRNYCKENNIDMTIPINFGGIGSVIAHEITHGYDDQGRKFDGDGNLENWWNDDDMKLFNSKIENMEKQVSKYKLIVNNNTYKMNAHLTMGENIADLGGLELTKKSLLKLFDKKHHKYVLYLFFKSWANIWKYKAKDETMINRLASDPHAPPSFRGNMVSNIDEFYTVFNINENDDMYIDINERVKLY